MAKATLTPAETKVVEVAPAEVHLVLTLDEADALVSLLGRCSAFEGAYPIYDALTDDGMLTSGTYLVVTRTGDEIPTIHLRKV